MSEMSLFLMLKHGDKIINFILMISKYRSMLWRFYYNLWLKGVSWIQLRAEKCHMIGLVWHSNTPLQPPYGTIKIISCNFFLYMWYFTKKTFISFLIDRNEIKRTEKLMNLSNIALKVEFLLYRLHPVYSSEKTESAEIYLLHLAWFGYQINFQRQELLLF